MAHRRRPTLELLAELLEPLAHIGVSHVHLAKEVVGQAAVVVETAQVGAADVADLQLLVAGRAGGVLEVFELALAGLLLLLRCADFVELVESLCDGAGFAEDGDLQESAVDCVGEVGDLFELVGFALASLFLLYPLLLLSIWVLRGKEKHTKLFVCRISSGVFSNRRCADSMRRSQSSMYFCISRI